MSQARKVLRQAKFLMAFADEGVAVTTADVAGVRPRQVYRWLQNDPAFKALYEQAGLKRLIEYWARRIGAA